MIHLKFTSINQAGTQEQGLADATDYTYTIIGNYLGLLTGANATYRPLSNPLTAHDAGSSATINVAAFTMQVAGIQLPISAGAITGLAYGTLYYVYYDDPALLGGIVVFHATTIKEIAIALADRFYVGSITTPVAGQPDTIGNGDGGGGAQSGQKTTLYFLKATTVTLAGPGTVTNPLHQLDGYPTTFTKYAISGSPAGTIIEVLDSAPGVKRPYLAATLYLDRALPINNNASGTTYQALLFTQPGGNGSFTVIETIVAGTFPRQLIGIALPLGLNLSQLSVEFLVQTIGSPFVVELDVYNVYVEAYE
jgi:hypothetical protein